MPVSCFIYLQVRAQGAWNTWDQPMSLVARAALTSPTVSPWLRPDPAPENRLAGSESHDQLWLDDGFVFIAQKLVCIFSFCKPGLVIEKLQ